MEIRNAHAEDLDALIALFEEFQAHHSSLIPDVYGTPSSSELADWFKVKFDDSTIPVLIAIADGRAVAYSVVRFAKDESSLFRHPRSYAYIIHAHVTAEYRNRGIARALLEEIKRRARQAGISKIELGVNSANKEARAAWYSMGFRTSNETMDLEI
jgi:ribosomal protein S18 acetylase RimI-like enzyme